MSPVLTVDMDVLVDSCDQLEDVASEFDAIDGILKQLMQGADDLGPALASTKHHETKIHQALSRTTKAAEKILKEPETANINAKEAESLLDRTIVSHFVRSGHQKAALELEAGEMTMEIGGLRRLEGLMSSLDDRGEEALSWADEHRDFLRERGSALPFELLEFVATCMTTPLESISMLRQRVALYPDVYNPRDVGRLVTMCIAGHDSPLRAVKTQSRRLRVRHLFETEYCAYLGLAPESPLLLAAHAGMLALPVIEKWRKISKGMQWTSKNELPVEIELPDALNFHPIFVCPVTKEQATEENPAMLLPCKHLISREALNHLGRRERMYRCPYCSHAFPREATRSVKFI